MDRDEELMLKRIKDKDEKSISRSRKIKILKSLTSLMMVLKMVPRHSLLVILFIQKKAQVGKIVVLLNITSFGHGQLVTITVLTSAIALNSHLLVQMLKKKQHTLLL